MLKRDECRDEYQMKPKNFSRESVYRSENQKPQFLVQRERSEPHRKESVC